MHDRKLEHKFKLDGESLTDFHINIELKNSTQILQKSMLREKKLFAKIDFIFLDSVAAHLRLGPNEPGNKGNHWRKMVDKPEDRIFMWHELTCAE